jgi:ABC-type phosphate transport system permease subunit
MKDQGQTTIRDNPVFNERGIAVVTLLVLGVGVALSIFAAIYLHN